jgi:hydrogenase expression/formation protein HypD
MNTPKTLTEIRSLSKNIGRPVRLMEVCGTHTVAAFKTGLRSLLPDNVSLLSGPGCPVCVTPNAYLDFALEIAKQPRTVIATFGDMLRVPGTVGSLEKSRAQGSDVRII